MINVTSPGRLYHGLRRGRGAATCAQGTTGAEAGHLGELILPDERRAPIVTVQDGASHALSFLGSAFGARVVPLGVDEFGQSGTRADLYRYYGIDAENIVVGGAAGARPELKYPSSQLLASADSLANRVASAIMSAFFRRSINTLPSRTV